MCCLLAWTPGGTQGEDHFKLDQSLFPILPRVQVSEKHDALHSILQACLQFSWTYGNWRACSSVYFDHDTGNSFNIADISSIIDSPFWKYVFVPFAKGNSQFQYVKSLCECIHTQIL